MITFFSTPKPFRGHIGIIQRNAIQSWKLVHPAAEVILFGDEEGAAEAARELGARHEPEVDRNSLGTPLLSSLFDRADRLARHARLCFLNADILLTGDFLAASERLANMHECSLMVGRRCDVNINEPWDFSKPDWDERLRSMAREHGKLRPPQWIDYFVFPRGLLSGQVPLDARAGGGCDARGAGCSSKPRLLASSGRAERSLARRRGAAELCTSRKGALCHDRQRDAPAYAEGPASELLSLDRTGEAQGGKRPQRGLVRIIKLNSATAPPAGAAAPPQSRVS
jgi:hypothetical protein